MWLSHFQIGALSEVESGAHASSGELTKRISIRQSEFQSAGLGPGKRLILYRHNTIAAMIDLLACWRCGAAAIPLDGRTPDSVRALWEAGLQPHARVFSPDPLQILEQEVPLWPESVALALMTSGSSGEPRLILHTQEAIQLKLSALLDAIPREDFAVTLCALPTFFGHGLICNALFPWLHGAHVHLRESFAPAFLPDMDGFLAANRIRFFSSTPALWNLLKNLARPQPKPELRRVHCASATLDPSTAEFIGRWAGSAQAWNVYGLTEFLGWVSGAPLTEELAVGRGWSTEIRLDESGEVVLRAPFRMFARANVSKALDLSMEDGQSWYSTRDRGEWSAGGLRLMGRVDFVINKGGLKIQPEEVEAALLSHPLVQDGFCGALPDPLWGQRTALAVIPRAGAQLNAAELRSWLAQRLPSFKVPDEIKFAPHLKRNARGKWERSRFETVWSQL